MPDLRTYFHYSLPFSQIIPSCIILNHNYLYECMIFPDQSMHDCDMTVDNEEHGVYKKKQQNNDKGGRTS